MADEKDSIDLEDLRSLQYMWEKNQDLESVSYWKTIEPLLARDYPEILKAWQEHKTSIRTLTAVLAHAVDTAT